MKQIRFRHWLVVLLLALAAHAALLLRFQINEDLTAADAGRAGVRIALAPTQNEPQPEQVAADGTPADADAQPDPAPPEPKPKPEQKPEPQTKLPPEPEPTAVPNPAPKPEPKPEPPPEPEPSPKPAPKPKPEPKPEPRPSPQQRSEPSPQTTTARRNPDAEPAGGSDPSNAPARTAQKSARSQAGSTGSVSDTPPDYQSELGAALARHKNYPRRARRLRQEGTAILYFVMDRDGHVLSWKIRESSGHELLDAAVGKMIKDADPLPPLPDNVPMQRLALTVPVSFRLR